MRNQAPLLTITDEEPSTSTDKGTVNLTAYLEKLGNGGLGSGVRSHLEGHCDENRQGPETRHHENRLKFKLSQVLKALSLFSL